MIGCESIHRTDTRAPGTLVIVRRGYDGDGVRFAIDKFTADVVKAVP